MSFSGCCKAARETTETVFLFLDLNLFVDLKNVPSSSIHTQRLEAGSASGVMHDSVCVSAVSYTHLTLPTKIGV